MLRDWFFSGARNALQCLDAEQAHALSLRALRLAEQTGTLGLLAPPVPAQPALLCGLALKNPVGIAPGFDKNGECIDALAALGFGFIEIGTVTPKPQAGNPKPRVFRLPEHEAVINRLGFNNAGIDALLNNVARARYRGVLGINIGKNKDTDNKHALQDYLLCLERVFPHASYITVNISSPNTQGLRELQLGDALKGLLDGLYERAQQLSGQHAKQVPLLVKLAPDLSAAELAASAHIVLASGFQGAILSNTTLSRVGVETHKRAQEAGGLSGRPLFARATATLKQFRELVGDKLSLIGVGGILAGADALEKRTAGADAVQFYTGFVYRGPALIRECVAAWNLKPTDPTRRATRRIRAKNPGVP